MLNIINMPNLKYIKKILLSYLFLILVFGCKMGPDYKRPCINMPKDFRFATNDVALTANTKWWEQFNDPVLDELIAIALACNRNVKIAAANIEQASGILMTTRSALFPQINYSGSATRNRASENLAFPPPTPNPYNNFQILAGATWEIDLWGRIRRQTESARANMFASIEARRGVILSLVAEVGAAYIQLRALDMELEISKKTLKSYSDALKYFELQFKYGQVPSLNVEQARSQYETAASQIPPIEIQIAQTENAISILLGQNPGPIPRGLPLEKLKMPFIPEGLPCQLLAQRPDVLQAEQQLVAANAEIGAAIAQYFPSLSLTGSYGFASDSLSNLFKHSSSTWNYGASILGPIFTAGAIQGQVIQAKGATKAACQAYLLSIQQALADVANALISRSELEKQLVAENNLVTAFKNYRDLAWQRYHGGYSPYLEVIYAESQLFPAELSAVQVKAATFISLINVYKAIGGGWVIEAERMTCP